jgi:hypothetical protein
MSPREPANGEYSAPTPNNNPLAMSWNQPKEVVPTKLLALLDVVVTGIFSRITDSVLLS